MNKITKSGDTPIEGVMPGQTLCITINITSGTFAAISVMDDGTRLKLADLAEGQTIVVSPSKQMIIQAKGSPKAVYSVDPTRNFSIALAGTSSGGGGQLLPATNRKLGAVIIGDGLDITDNGTVSVNLGTISDSISNLPNIAFTDRYNLFSDATTHNAVLTANGPVNLNSLVAIPNIAPAATAPITEATAYKHLIARDIRMAQCRDIRQINEWPGEFTTPLAENSYPVAIHTGKNGPGAAVGLYYESYNTARTHTGRWQSAQPFAYGQQDNILVGPYDEGAYLFTAPKIMALSRSDTDGDYVSFSLVNNTGLIGVRLINRSGVINREYYSSDLDGQNETIYSSQKANPGHTYYGYPSILFCKSYQSVNTWTISYEGQTVNCGNWTTAPLAKHSLRLEISIGPSKQHAYGAGRGVWAQTCTFYSKTTADTTIPIPSATNRQLWGLTA